MLRIDAILAPVDLSEASGSTLRCVSALARQFHSTVTLLYVGDANEESRDRAEALATKELGPLPFSCELSGGEPARVIVNTASSGRFGLIAMATHGYSPFRQLLLGSVTTRVLDETECPVFTGVHLENAASTCHAGFPNVVCAVDLGPKSGQVARWAADFSAAVQGRLFLVHAIPSLGAMADDYYRQDGDVGPAHRAYEQLNALRQEIGFPASPLVVGGEITDAVTRQANELGAGVLIAGRGMAAGRLGRLRSQALKIIRAAPCPVITI